MQRIGLTGKFGEDKGFSGMDGAQCRYGIHDSSGDITFIRAKYELVDGTSFADSEFNPLDDLIPVRVEAFNFVTDKWEPHEGTMNKLTSLKHAFVEDPTEVLERLDKARASFKEARNPSPDQPKL